MVDVTLHSGEAIAIEVPYGNASEMTLNVSQVLKGGKVVSVIIKAHEGD